MRIPTKKFIKKLLYAIVPFNIKYKPIGLYQGFEQSEVYFREIFPPFRSVLNIPQNLYNACTEYIRTPEIVDVPPSYIIEVVNGRIYATNTYIAVINNDNLLISEASYHHVSINQFGIPEKNTIFNVSYFINPANYKGTVFTMLSGGGAVGNYGHWLIDAIPRIGLLKKSGLFEEVDWFIVPSYKYDFQVDTLSLLGIPSEKIIVAGEVVHIQADRIIASTTTRHIGHFPEWAIDFLNSSFSDTIKPKQYPPRVYIRRSDSSIRNILNEEELVMALGHYGFVDYELSKFSFAEKVNLFRSADFVISATGAGLANLIFCKKGAKVMEIFNSSFISTMFADMAYKAEIDYSYIINESKKKVKSLRKAEYGHFTVDIDKIIDKIKSILHPVDLNHLHVTTSGKNGKNLS